MAANADESGPVPIFLQPDAEWKSIQQNTFTRWVNNHLTKAGESVYNLETDLCDGLRLIKLVEVLSHKKLTKHNRKVTFRSQKLENVSLALKFLQDVEHIKIVTIDSSHIVDSNRKLILGLIWTLIVHYSMSMGSWEGDREEGAAQDQTPKQRLLTWIRAKLPSDVPVTNFTSDWNDGVALGALVDALAPGRITAWREWHPDNALGNTKKAMQLAQDDLGVAQLITPEELINPNIDEKSVMTYLSQFPQAKKAIPKGAISQLEEHPFVGVPTTFVVTVPTENYKPRVTVHDSEGAEVPIHVAKVSPVSYTVAFVPEQSGEHQVSLFVVHAATGDGKVTPDAEATVTARRAGRVLFNATNRLGTGATVPVRIVEAEDAEADDFDIVVTAPDGREEKLLVTATGHEEFAAVYAPTTLGVHMLTAARDGKPLVDSPFPLAIKSGVASDLYAWGRGLAATGIQKGDVVQVHVDAVRESANLDTVDLMQIHLETTIVDADGDSTLINASSLDSDRKTFEYTAPAAGHYAVHVTADGHHVALSPYKITVSESGDLSRVRAFGPGLEGGVAMLPSIFYVETNGEQSTLSFSVEGPSQTEITCKDRGNGSAVVEYTPPTPGVYSVSVLSNNDHIKNSPFVLQVDPSDANLRPSEVRVVGLERPVHYLQNPIKFDIDTTHASDKLLIPSVSILDASLSPVENTVTQLVSARSTASRAADASSGHFACKCQPVKVGQHYVNVAVKGVSVPGAPFPVLVVDPRAVSIYGPGVEGPVESLQPTHFTIDAKQAGPGTLEVALSDREGRQVDIDVLDNEDGSFTVKYTAPKPGAYQLNVVFAGAEMPKIEINVKPHVDVGGIRVEGLENEVLVGAPMVVTVDPGKNEPSHKGVEVFIRESGGRPTRVPVERREDGKQDATIVVSKEGECKVQVLFDGLVVKEEKVRATKRADASKVLVKGDGLQTAVVNETTKFKVDTRHAGIGKLHIEITGPEETKTTISDHGDGTATVDYLPLVPGVYTLSIMYGKDKQHVPGSPFRSVADYLYRPETVTVEGLQPLEVRSGQVKRFVVDASRTEAKEIGAILPVGQQQPFVVERERERRVYDVHFTPTLEDGADVQQRDAKGRRQQDVQLEVTYGGEQVAGSPFLLSVLPESDPSAVRLVTSDSVAASRDGVVLIDKSSAGKLSDVVIDVTGPDGRRRRYEQSPTSTPDVDELRFRTDLPGDYIITVRQRVKGELKAVKTTTLRAEARGKKEHITQHAGETEALWPIGVDRKFVLRRAVDDPSARLALLETSGLGVEYAVDSKKIDENTYEDTILIRARKSGLHRIVVLYGGVEVDVIEFEALLPEEVVERKKKAEEAELAAVQAAAQKASASPPPKPISRRGSGEKARVSTDRERQVAANEKRYYEGAEHNNNEDAAEQKKRFPNGGSASHPSSTASTPSAAAAAVTAEDGGGASTCYDQRVFPFDFDPREIISTKLEAVVTMPSSKKDAAEIVDNGDGTVLVKYTPKTSGNHVLSILHQGTLVQGTPISFFVDQYSDGYATIYGPGTQGGVVGEPAHFTVSAKHGHAKELTVSIEGPAQANIKIHDNKDGTCSVSWVPPLPGEYKVHVKLAGRELSQSPFKVLVAGEGSKRAHLSVGSTSEVALNITQTELKGISASIKSPSGIEEPCFVRIIEGGRLGVSFTPREAGEHLITVKRDGVLVPRAPFKIKVDKSQVGDASRVEVTGDGRGGAITQQWNELLVDTTKAGYGGLSISVQGPSKAELQCKEKKTGLVQVQYKPSEPGVYAIAIKFADHHVPLSPFTVHCTGKGGGAVREEIKRSAEQSGIALPDQDANLYFKLLNVSPMDMVARVMDPKGNTEDVEMRDSGGSIYVVKLHPKVEGVHALSVLHKDAHVNGSPFQFTVGSFSEGGAHKVRASGMGVVRGETNHTQSFNVYTREAGAGSVSVVIEGPSKAVSKFEDHKDGSCHVDYKVSVPGEYTIAIKFNDTHIPDSPFKVFIAPATGEVRKLELASFHDSGIPVGKAFTFTVLTHRARGHLEAKVLTPNGETETIDIVPIEDGESYALRFVPKESGNHYIHVTLDGAPMRDSPFRLRVGGKDECDPTAIHANGEGLMRGQTGQKCEFIVNTANAGSGILTIQMDGPSKVTLDAYELEHGYKGRYTPLAPGDYFAAIKYNGIHVPGSPFKIRVEGKELGGNGYNETAAVKIDAVAKTSKGTVAVAPTYKGDASKVTAKGAGLNKFFPGRPAMFTLDTALAGPNILLIAVATTKGPCEEVVVKHQGNGHYVCTYRIQERVKGFVYIKYGDQEIPGSPFALEY